MAKCFVCGADCAARTCSACARRGPPAGVPEAFARELTEAPGRLPGAPPGRISSTDEKTGFEAVTAEVPSAEPKTAEPKSAQAKTVEPKTAEPKTDAVPLEVLSESEAPTGEVNLAPVPLVALEPLDVAHPADAVAHADAAKPPHRLAKWNSILDTSPVFAGHGPFDVKTPVAPAPHTLDVAIGVRFGVPSAPAGADTVVPMMVTLTPSGAPIMEGREGPVAHIILALDLSASMNHPGKYPVLTRALTGMFRELRARWYHEVLVSIVAFAWGAETIVRAEPVSRLDERDVLRRLDGWSKRFTRYTDLVGGLKAAGGLARDSVRACRAMPVRIYVLTDGKPQDMAGAQDVMQRLAKAPVDVHGLAFGDDADIDSLSQLLSGGRGGTVKHIRSETIEEAFGRIGDVSQQVVANRALLDVELRGGVIGGDAFRYRPARHRYPKGSFVRGIQFSTDLGTLESGRAYSLLFHLRVRPTDAAETEVGRIVLRVPGFGGPRTFETIVSIPRHAGTVPAEPDPEVQAAVDVVTALDSGDPVATLRALRIRRDLYVAERRDTHVVWVLDKAIQELERRGSLAGLSASEHATLVSHTLTMRGGSGGGAPAAASSASASAASEPSRS